MKTIRDNFIALVLTVLILWAASAAWQRWGYHDENERDSSAEGAAHYHL